MGEIAVRSSPNGAARPEPGAARKAVRRAPQAAGCCCALRQRLCRGPVGAHVCL